MSETKTLSSTPSTRDKLRSQVLSKNSQSREKRVITMMGSKVEIRCPTLKQIQDLGAEAKKEDGQPLVKSLIEYCYVPGTNEKLFDETDSEGLLDLEASKWLSDFNKAIEDMTGVKVEDVEKNLEKTA